MSIRREEDVSDFSEFVAARSAALFRTAFLVVGEYQLAQDLLQEALVKVYVAWPRLRDRSKAEAYARRTIVNTAISWRRRRSFQERPVALVPDSSTDDTGRLAAHGELWERVRSLPPRQRAALVLRYYEDLSERETAALLSCSVGTVKSQVSAALSRLRLQVSPDSGVLLPDDEKVTR